MIEMIKNLIIVFLSCSALFLLSQVEIFSRVSTYLLDDTVQTVKEVDLLFEEQLGGVLPLAVVALDDMGQRGLQYEEGIEDFFSLSSQILKEALGNLTTVEEISFQEFQQLLTTAPSLYFQWGKEIPLVLLESYLSDGQLGEREGTVSGILLSPWKEGMALIYQSKDRYYACPVVALEEGRLEAVIDHLGGEALAYAFSLEGYELVEPLTLVSPVPLSKMVYRGSTAISSDLSGLLEILGFQSSANAQYSSSDGLVVRGSTDSLRLSDEGQITYQGEEQTRYFLPKEGTSITLFEQVEGARRFASQILQDLETIPQLQFYGIQQEGEGLWIQFSATLDGVPLAFGDSLVAAEFLLVEEAIQEFSLWYRHYLPLEIETPILPIRQAQDIMETFVLDGLLLVYQDSGRETVSATWVSP
ncbi:MAG: hypothetical protein R3Y63_12430 [Eubacteriales bacterium]